MGVKVPVWIDMRSLTKREAAVMHAWHERLHAISEAEGGRPIHFLGEALPVLLEVIDELCPRLKGKRYLEMIGKLGREEQRAYQLFHGEAGNA